MPGFPFAAIGAGLGQWAKAQQEQQAARERQQMLQLTLARFQQEQQDRQNQQQAASGEWGMLTGGGNGIAPVNPTGGGFPGSQAAPGAMAYNATQPSPQPPPAMRPSPTPGGGGGPLGARGDALSDFAPGNRNEGMTVTSRGPTAESYAGLSGPGAPTEATAGTSWAPVPGYPTSNRPPPTPTKDTRGAGNVPEMQVADASGARQQLAQTIPQEANGRMSATALAQQIERAMPGARPEAKLKVLKDELARLAPLERERVQLEMQRNSQIFTESMADKRAERSETAADKRAQRQIDMEERREINREGRDTAREERKQSAAGKPQLLEYTKEDGTVERVEAQQLRNGQWVTADQLRSPIDVSKGKWSIVPASQAGALGGSRDAAQRERQLIAGREVISDLQNVVALPITTTRGIFGGRTQGPGLLDALKENLAEKMTDEDAELANSALAGLERELSIIVSPVYGGKWAAESFGALKLKEGQTNSVKLYNLARMRQTADNALEAMVTSPRIGEAQKQYAKDMREMLDKAVPWTPADVLAYRSKGDDRQTFGQFVADQGISGSATKGEKAPSASGGPEEDDVASAPGKPDLVFRGGKWVPVQ